MKLDQAAPIATVAELANYDAIIFGTPTRFGNMCAQMRNFLDQTGGLWVKGALVGKSEGLKETVYLRSHLTAGEFKLTFQVKLSPNSSRAGVQYHSALLPEGGLHGPQASLGATTTLVLTSR